MTEKNKIYKNASDFAFGIVVNYDNSFGIRFSFKNKVSHDDYLNCPPIKKHIKKFFPKKFRMSEIDDSFFLIEEKITYNEIKDKFINQGFVHSQTLENVCM